LPAGQYDVFLGVTWPGSGERLPIAGTPDDRLALGQIRVPRLDVAAAHEAMMRVRTVVPYTARDRLPVHSNPDGGQVAGPVRGPVPAPVVVLSVPKAGTYLLGKLLEQFGLCDTGLHLSLHCFEDYRHATMAQMTEVHHEIRLCHAAQLIDLGQFAVGHVPHCTESLVALHRFKKFFIARNLRDTLVSNLRHTLRDNLYGQVDALAGLSPVEQLAKQVHLLGDHQFGLCREVLGWLDEPDVLPVSFETLLGDAGPGEQATCVAAIARHLGAADVPLPAGVLSAVIGQPTLTFSGRRSHWQDYWSDEVERWFCESGFQELNRRLGYPDA
jgi:hypothetical protein